MKEMSRYLDTPIGSYRPGKLVGVGPVSRVYLIERQSESERQLVLKLFEAVPLDQLEAKDQVLDEIRLPVLPGASCHFADSGRWYPRAYALPGRAL